MRSLTRHRGPGGVSGEPRRCGRREGKLGVSTGRSATEQSPEEGEARPTGRVDTRPCVPPGETRKGDVAAGWFGGGLVMGKVAVRVCSASQVIANPQHHSWKVLGALLTFSRRMPASCPSEALHG